MHVYTQNICGCSGSTTTCVPTAFFRQFHIAEGDLGLHLFLRFPVLPPPLEKMWKSPTIEKFHQFEVTMFI